MDLPLIYAYPVLGALVIAMTLNFVAYVIAFLAQTDKLTDLTYSLSFIAIAVWMQFAYTSDHWSKLLIAALPILWALRLGSYLFFRILKKGRDYRFDEMRPVWWRFGGFWLLQAISVWIISLPYVQALCSRQHIHVERVWLLAPGLLIFITGMIIEAVADHQKSRFRSRPENAGQFISTGLYKKIRYPNYLGEMLIWIGIYLTCLPYFSTAGMYLTIISPLWVITLLIKISGIPYLEKSQHQRYGGLDSYKQYVSKTHRLLPGIY